MVPAMTETIDQAIRRYAGAHANVATGIACEGTALEATTFNIARKAFLFLRTVEGGQEVRLKLDASRAQFEKLGEQWPDSYSIGSSGWAKVIVSEERSLVLLESWIAESYGLISGKVAPMPVAKQAAKPAAKPAKEAATPAAAKPVAAMPAKPAKEAAKPKQAAKPEAAKPSAKEAAKPKQAAKPAAAKPSTNEKPATVTAAKPAAKEAAKKPVAKAKPAAKEATKKVAAKKPAKTTAKKPAAKKPTKKPAKKPR